MPEYNDAGEVTSPRPFRVCEECRALTPANTAHCVQCGHPSIDLLIEYERQQREHLFTEAILGRPVRITYFILAINFLVYLAMVLVAGGDYIASLLRMNDLGTLIAFGAKTNYLLAKGELFRLVTPIFIHGGLLHLALNSYAIWTTGPLVERLYGRSRYFLIYLVSGIGGVVGSYLGSLFRSQDVPSVGASGAIFGLFGLLFVIGYHHRNELPAGFGGSIRSAVVPVIVINLISGLSVPMIDNGAHIGGLLTGAALALVIPFLPADRRHDLPLFNLLLAICLALTLASFVGSWLSSATHLHRRVVEVRQFIGALEAVDEELVSIMKDLARDQPLASEQVVRLEDRIDRLAAQPGPDAAADVCRQRLLNAARNVLQFYQSAETGSKYARWQEVADEIVATRQLKIDWVKQEGGRYGLRLAPGRSSADNSR